MNKLILLAFVVACSGCFGKKNDSTAEGKGVAEKPASPNILVIMTDQQNATMMSCTGNQWLKTPALDALAARGVRFEKAYATNPVCLPSRFSIQTGSFPSAIGVRENDRHIDDAHVSILEQLRQHALGNTFRNAGYDTYYGGKVHLPPQIQNPVPWGYDLISKDVRGELAQTASDFLLKRSKTGKPFLMFVSFMNPHDICFDAIRAGWPGSPEANATPPDLFDAMKIPDGYTREAFFEKLCPPLPANHQPMFGESYVVDSAIRLRSFRKAVRDNWTDEDWRMHRWAYARLTENADSLIGQVLSALDKSGLSKNTIVIFTSDHGDNDGSHKLEHKTFFYEESSRIPFIIAYPWMEKKGIVDSNHLVSNGLDILPTLCDLAGINPPSNLPGKSIKPVLASAPVKEWRDHIFMENQLGYMIHTGRYKYELDDKSGDRIREVFTDLAFDPGETCNMINNVKYAAIINGLRKELTAHLRASGIRFDYPEGQTGER
jgi:choline-sulfatase